MIAAYSSNQVRSTNRNRSFFFRRFLCILGAICLFQSSTTERGFAQQPDNPVKVEKASESKGQGWWFFRGDSAGTGYKTKNPLPKKLKILWEEELIDGGFEASPVSKGNQIILADVYGKVLSLDLKTGRQNWLTDTKLGFSASPTIVENKIYVGDIDGVFRCFDLKTGKILWKVETGGAIDSSANVYKDQILFGSQDAIFYAVDKDKGNIVWKYETKDQIRCSISVVGDQSFVAGCDGHLHIINLKTHKGAGKVSLDAQTAATPAISNELVYFGTEDGRFLAVDRKAKNLRWAFKDRDGGGSIRGSASVTNQHVVFGTRGKKIVCLDKTTGKVRWIYRSKRKVDGSPLILGDRVYIGDGDGSFLVLDIKNGNRIQKLTLEGVVIGAPILVKDRIIVATDQGFVYCLGKEDRSK